MPAAAHPSRARHRGATLAALASALLAPLAAGGDAPRLAPVAAGGEVTRQAMQVQLLSPAVAADGKQVALASLDPAGAADASGSLALFEPGGALKRRIPLWAPARDAERARRSYAEAMKVLEEGGFRRMGRVKRNSEHTALRRSPSDPPPSFEGVFSQGDYGFTLRVADGKVRVEAMKGSRKLGSWTLKLGPSPPCGEVAGYSISPTRAGFEADRRVLAFSVHAERDGGEVCFSHDFVVTTK